MSRITIDLDDKLIKEGIARLKCQSKKELVHLALRELVLRERRKDILQLSGKIHWEGELKA